MRKSPLQIPRHCQSNQTNVPEFMMQAPAMMPGVHSSGLWQCLQGGLSWVVIFVLSASTTLSS